MSLVIRGRTVLATTPARCANSKARPIPNRRSTALRPTSRMLPEPEWFTPRVRKALMKRFKTLAIRRMLRPALDAAENQYCKIEIRQST